MTRSRRSPRIAALLEPALALAVAAAVTVILGGWFTPVRFDEEQIEIAVRPGELHVTGLYAYTNASPLPALLTLRVPFPIDARHPRPHGVAGAEAGESMSVWHPLTFDPRGEDLACRLLFAPGERKWVRLEYLQEAREPSGRYILTTTRAWGRALARADFRVSLTAGVELAWSSYELDRLPAPAGEQRFGFSRRGFMPDRDWIFGWRPSIAGHAPRAEATG
jgi:hypothetical protein